LNLEAIKRRDAGENCIMRSEFILFAKYYFGDQIKEEKTGTACRAHGDEKCVKNFDRNSEGKRPVGIYRRRWMDNIKMDLREIGWEGVDWIYVAQDRDRWRALVNTVMNLRDP
jgi:hypothetical protein